NPIRSLATQCVEVFPKCVDVLCRVVVDAHARGLRLRDDAVFNVGDIHDVRHVIAFELEIPAKYVGCDRRTEVTDVTVIPNRGATGIETNLTLSQRMKFFYSTAYCVSDPY